jgi:hypothetical protein
MTSTIALFVKRISKWGNFAKQKQKTQFGSVISAFGTKRACPSRWRMYAFGGIVTRSS